MADLITDEMLEVYAVTGTWNDMPGLLAKKYAGVADHLIFYFANEAWEKGTETMAQWKDMIWRTRALLPPS